MNINEFIGSIDAKLYNRIRNSKGNAECRRYLKEHFQKQLTLTSVGCTLKDKEAISFGRYCATRGYHKFEGNWVNRQKYPRDIEWIKKIYNKEIFDL